MDLFKYDEKFLMVGYSFGSMLAIKLASTLKNLNKSGKVIFVDGAPKFLKKLSIEHFPQNFTKDDVRSVVLTNAIFISYPDDDGRVFRAVLNEKTWDYQVKKFVELYPGEKLYSEQYANKILNASVNRIMITLKMSLKEFPQIQNISATLIRTTEPTVSNIEKNYGLTDFIKNIVDVIYLEGNHETVLNNPKLIEIINNVC